MILTCNTFVYIKMLLYFSTTNNVELGLWIGRYASTFLLFVVGFYAPGIQQGQYNLNVKGDEEKQVRK